MRNAPSILLFVALTILGSVSVRAQPPEDWPVVGEWEVTKTGLPIPHPISYYEHWVITAQQNGTYSLDVTGVAFPIDSSYSYSTPIEVDEAANTFCVPACTGAAGELAGQLDSPNSFAAVTRLQFCPFPNTCFDWPFSGYRTPYCGDGIVSGGEACDDGNATDGDGCDTNCTFTACGNGIVAGTVAANVSEQCDDGNNLDGDCCDSTCQYEASGSRCLDATVCNGDEQCNGTGICSGGVSLNCNDGDACTADLCDPVSGCFSDDAPATGCLTPGKSMVLIKKNAGDPTKDKLLWKWTNGAELDQGELADPTTSDGYGLCVYSGNTLVAGATIPPETGWSAVGDKGYRFKGTSPNGLSVALLKGGAEGKSKALVKGKGGGLPDPILPLAYPVTVQLKKDGSSLCLESTFTLANEKKNTTTQFKAKQ